MFQNDRFDWLPSLQCCLTYSQQPVKSAILKHGGKSASQESVTICKIHYYSAYVTLKSIINYVKTSHHYVGNKQHIRWVYCQNFEYFAWNSYTSTWLFHLFPSFFPFFIVVRTLYICDAYASVVIYCVCCL